MLNRYGRMRDALGASLEPWPLSSGEYEQHKTPIVSL